MNDTDLLTQIHGLIETEHQLRGRDGEHATPDDVEQLRQDDVEQLRQIQVALDQCWDLLRQRRARQEFGKDPADAALRPASTVEGYVQ